MWHPIQMIWERLNRFVLAFFEQLPDIIVGVLIIFIFWILSRIAARAIRNVCKRRHKPDLGEVMSGLAKGAIMIFSLLVASAVVFPSVSPANILSALGFGSVAVGFAFKDILQNLMAGILILARRPYARGDRIIVKGFEGTVTAIESRATMLKTLDGRRVVIPNSDCYNSVVVVVTHFPIRRYEAIIGIGYSNDVGKAIDMFMETIKAVEGVCIDPEPEVLSHELGDSTYNLKVRWWSDNSKFNPFHVGSNVILTLYRAAVKAGVDMPFPTQTLLLPNLEKELHDGLSGAGKAKGKAKTDAKADDDDTPKVGEHAEVSIPKKVQSAGEAKQQEAEQTAVPKEGRGEVAQGAVLESEHETKKRVKAAQEKNEQKDAQLAKDPEAHVGRDEPPADAEDPATDAEAPPVDAEDPATDAAEDKDGEEDVSAKRKPRQPRSEKSSRKAASTKATKPAKPRRPATRRSPRAKPKTTG